MQPTKYRSLDASRSPTIVDLKIAAFRPAKLLESLPESSHPELSFGITFAGRHQHAEAPDAVTLRARRERPCRGRAAEQRDEVPPVLTELHALPTTSGGRTAGYRIDSDQSAGMLEFCNHSWFCLRWRAIARYTFGTMNAQIERCSRPRPRHTWQWWS